MEAETVKLLHPVVRILVAERGWKDLTNAQRQAIPYIASGYNVLLIAPTGYGKTEAALLPILSKMVEEKPEPVALIYITPLRALINNLTERINWWASRLGIRTARKHGDVPQSEKAKRLRNAPHIIILTPESLEIDLDWATRFREKYRNVRWVIVDEVHELASSKRGVQLSLLLERLRRLASHDFQVIGLSATVEEPQTIARMLFGSSRRKWKIIETDVAKDLELRVEYIEEDGQDSWNTAARRVVETLNPPSLIFVNSRFTAERLHESLERIGVSDIFVHHSSVSRQMREKAEERLKRGELKAIVCTKTLELGIDVGEIRSVVLFRPPGTVASLLQRVGRSGHTVDGKSSGVLINIGVMDLLESVALSRLAARKKLEPPPRLEKPLDVLARTILGICLQKKEASVEEIYEIARSTYHYRDLKPWELESLIDYLALNEMIVELPEGRIRLGRGFYKIWRFDNSDMRWMARSFTEFFSLISERDSFTVKHGDRIVGDLDVYYVYRHLRVGDVIRLSGRSWRIVDIDEVSMKVEVVPAEAGSSEVPLWRGEGVRRSRILASEVSSLLEELWEGREAWVPENVHVSPSAAKKLYELVEYHKRKGIPLPSTKRLIVERIGDEVFFISMMGQNVAETLAHILMHMISAKDTTDVAIRASYYGFSVRTRSSDPVRLLLSLEPEKVPELAASAAKRSPLLYVLVKELQYSFGKIGKPDVEKDKLLLEEAVRQTIASYFDIEGAKEFVEKLRRGEIEVVERLAGPPSPFSLALRRMPTIRPWFRDATLLIVKNLEGMAYTVDELAEIVELPPRTVESKLKELRKPGSPARVFQFIDVSFNEWRWALVKDVETIAGYEEFVESFSPEDVNEAFVLMLKPLSGESYYTILFTPKDIMSDMERFARKVPYDETYEVKVMPLADNLLKSLAPKYYHVPRKVLPYIALNGVAYIQRLKGYG